MSGFRCPECNCAEFDRQEYAWDHPFHYDGISELHCLDCGQRFGRWTKKKLADGEYEPPFGIDRRPKAMKRCASKRRSRRKR